MGFEIDHLNGQTHLDEDEKEGLLLDYITTRKELNEFEQLNIQKAMKWSQEKTFQQDHILSESFIKLVHRKMFGDIWEWAGSFRKSNKNIGIDWHQISIEVRSLNTDCKYWMAKNTYTEDELAIRFKHRLVKIHCFPNGNGRHSRLMADILISDVLGRPVFSWGGRQKLAETGLVREQYMEAIRTADKGDIEPLVEFSRN